MYIYIYTKFWTIYSDSDPSLFLTRCAKSYMNVVIINSSFEVAVTDSF